MAIETSTGVGYPVVAEALRKTYVTSGGVAIVALNGIDLEIDSSSVVALTGPSGSGKSTLLHLLGGMDTADSGSLRVGDTELTSLPRAKLVAFRRTVGFVFQHFALLPALTARDNVLLPVLPYSVPFDPQQRADVLLAQMGLGGREDALPSQLSGGQRQRVAIARALMGSPRLLIADEPTGNLDSSTGEEILSILLGLREERQLTIVIGTHDQRLTERCDVILHLRDGTLTPDR